MQDVDVPAGAHWAYDDAGLDTLRSRAQALLSHAGAVATPLERWPLDRRWVADDASWNAGLASGWGDIVVTPDRLPELGAVAEAAGRTTSAIPLLGTSLAAAVAAGRSPDVVERIRAGAPAALLWTGPQEPPALTASTVSRGRTVVDGRLPFVVDAPAAGLFVAAALDPRGETVVCVLDRAPGVTTRAMMDPTRPVGAVHLAQIGADVIAHGSDADAALADAWQRGAALLALDAVGAAAGALELTVEYAGRRRQFGQLIGGFQAVSHRCADMLVALETSRSLARHAPWAVVGGNSPVAAICAAKSAATENAVEVARAGIQLHGGIGMTWACAVQVLYKRAWLDRALLGDPTYHRELLLRELELEPPVPGRPLYRTPF